MWFRILAGLAKINPADVMTQINLQDVADLIRVVAGG